MEFAEGRYECEPQEYALTKVILNGEASLTRRPVPLIVKSVCDFADNQKSDDYQRFAAYSSCEFAQFLYEKVLPLD